MRQIAREVGYKNNLANKQNNTGENNLQSPNSQTETTEQVSETRTTEETFVQSSSVTFNTKTSA